MTPKNIQGLQRLLLEVEKQIPGFDRSRPGVSAGSIGWHLDHLMLTVELTLLKMTESSPEAYRREYGFWRAVCIGLGWLPRGRAKAPKIVTPVSLKEASALEEQLSQVREQLQKAALLHPKQYMQHPFFGKLKRDTAFRFLEIHTRHHLQIIKEINAS